MKQKKDLILIGGGGHCRSCIDVIEMDGRFTIRGIVDERDSLDHALSMYPLLGREEDLVELAKSYKNFLITIGQIKTPEPRIRLFDHLKQLGMVLPIIVSPLAHVSRQAILAEGTIIMHDALVNAGASVGRNCIINTKALIEHDAVIEDHCHISTAAVVNGTAKIERSSFIGSNSVIRESVVVGESSIVGAGVAVLHHVGPHSVMHALSS
ncbi:MAG TPA: NeuD/PglB/VioB family sugar acetyltransferase [Nitrospira sp.]|nr:NeuD/PglB/VioB family sugar acetyltransferase [Nitrospira sp.]